MRLFAIDGQDCTTATKKECVQIIQTCGRIVTFSASQGPDLEAYAAFEAGGKAPAPAGNDAGERKCANCTGRGWSKSGQQYRPTLCEYGPTSLFWGCIFQFYATTPRVLLQRVLRAGSLAACSPALAR